MLVSPSCCSWNRTSEVCEVPSVRSSLLLGTGLFHIRVYMKDTRTYSYSYIVICSQLKHRLNLKCENHVRCHIPLIRTCMQPIRFEIPMNLNLKYYTCSTAIELTYKKSSFFEWKELSISSQEWPIIVQVLKKITVNQVM